MVGVDNMVGVFVGHHERSVMCRLMMLSDYASCLVSSDLRVVGVDNMVGVFVGHHERSVMCRLGISKRYRQAFYA